MHSVLHCYYEATLCSEGKDDHLGRWFSTLDFIFAKTWDSVCEFRRLDEENPRHPEYAFLAAAANSAWLKCEQYYKRADDSAAYYAAEVLQPSRKWTWLHQEWAEDIEKEPWLAVAKNAVQQLWEEEYKGKFGVPQGTTLVSRPRNPDDEFGSLSEHRKIRAIKPPANDAYQSFIERDPEGQATDDPLDYWNSRVILQPDLARFALDMLALPATSAECERVFSSAKLLITAARNRLHPESRPMSVSGLGSKSRRSLRKALSMSGRARMAGRLELVIGAAKRAKRAVMRVVMRTAAELAKMIVMGARKRAT